MRVLIFERDLLWSVRVANALRVLGHEATVLPPGAAAPDADAAILNLGDAAYDLPSLVAELRERGIKTIAHAGHKEKELHALGRELGCDVLATNSELANKLAGLLEKVASVSDR